MKKMIPIAISVLLFVVGLGVMFYPTVSSWIHEKHASYAVSNYLDQVSAKSSADYDAEFAAARAYNASLTGDAVSFLDAQEGTAPSDYWDLLNQVNGIMGVIEIPSINVKLPIYHGSEEEVLQKGAGHLEGSALPTGDVGNHTVITGHTGLPTATLFTDLDELELGDYFYLDISNQVFAYQVTNIYVVLPSETEQLQAQADKDLVTLVTCTPYGINSHRLLVQGERIDVQPVVAVSPEQETAQPQETEQTEQTLHKLLFVAVLLGVVLCVVIVIFIRNTRYHPRRSIHNDLDKPLEPNPPNHHPPTD